MNHSALLWMHERSHNLGHASCSATHHGRNLRWCHAMLFGADVSSLHLQFNKLHYHGHNGVVFEDVVQISEVGEGEEHCDGVDCHIDALPAILSKGAGQQLQQPIFAGQRWE